MGIFGKKGPKRDKKTGRFKAKHKGMRQLLNGKKATSMATNDATITQHYKKVEIEGGYVTIPVNKKGMVNEEALAMHFLDVKAGSIAGKKRNTAVDLNKSAKTIFVPDKNGLFHPEDIAEWWAHPNESDIQGIDTLNAPAFLLPTGLRKGSMAAQRKMAVIGANDSDYELIRNILDNSFTVRELKTMVKEQGLTIVVDPNLKSAAGQYISEMNTIRLNPKYVTHDTTIHEAVHHLRKTDPERKSAVSTKRTSGIGSLNDINLEEAATTAETIIRISPWAVPGNASYYGNVPDVLTSSDVHRAINSDRKRFTGSSEPGSKGLNGKRAVLALEKEFGESEISKIGYSGSKSARDHLKQLDNKKD